MVDTEHDRNNEPEWSDLDGRMTEFGHQQKIRVYYEDTDFSGIVYHANYLKFIERGRSDFIRQLGVHHSALDSGESGERLALAVRHMDINFIKSARIDDILTVESRVGEVKGARIFMDQRILRGDDLLFTARVTVVVITRDGRPRRLPDTLRTAFGL
ncbi:tol-pal system-associated acyl-CoA thioesterase [Cohaesibacter celericrescens]|uniref:Tol-pal system-associated acyl-CoA thioesterase n=1 Tax=Cohaesibacter celericrescens TaxID=2067669 RepID=A0A2N5XL03_9HYPH|nr:tol-pal system-associated acyl-CoA thioesterase [Cohaesibacter celericrescens]PLW75221.1 tol-pal system-associated acyl-CoA thioesterase [Cohaesibacter celericrescens]